MKHAIIVAFCAFLCISATAKTQEYEARTLVKETHKIYAGKHGHSRDVVTINVPPETEYLYYTIVAEPGGNIPDLKLKAQLHDAMKVGSFKISMAATLLNAIIAPPAHGSINTYMLYDALQAKHFANKQDGKDMWHDLPECRRISFSSGTLGMPIKYSKLVNQYYYLCLLDPHFLESEYVSIEVVAICRKTGK